MTSHNSLLVSTPIPEHVELILASQSPRRSEILDMMGLKDRYSVQPSPFDERTLQKTLQEQRYAPEDYVRILAEEKSKALLDTLPPHARIRVAIGSDTVVDLDGMILEKPVNREDAVRMLNQLSGKWHTVHTAVAIYAKVPDEDILQKRISFTESSRVLFTSLSEEDILAYVDTGEPMDKAGSYGIQGIGGQLIERINGDFFNIMGLPMHRLSRELSHFLRELSQP